jgi:adenylate kinase
MLKNKMEANPDVTGYILDGFPRTTPQAEALDEFLASQGAAVTALTAMKVDDEELVKRLLGRAITSGRSDDADESVIRNRIEVYNEYTAVVADHYAQSGKTVYVDGIGSIDEVFERLCTAIDSFQA